MVNLINWLFGNAGEAPDFLDEGEDFRVLGELGRGSYGVVSLVRQESTGKLFAAKRSLDPGRSVDLAEEINRSLKVNHRSVAKGYPYYFENEQGGIHILNEFAEGPSLLQFIEGLSDNDQRLSVAETAWIGREISLGLQAIHRQGMVHRDLSLNNVILSDGQPIIIDFGIAKESLCSLTGTLCGTPGFIAPEVGFSAATPKSDIFSIGSILYFLYFQNLIQDEYGRGLAPDLRFRKGFSGEEKALAEVVEKAIALNPGRRFQSANELAASLKPLSQGIDSAWWASYHNLLYGCTDVCRSCGAPLPRRANYCPYCGEKSRRRTGSHKYPLHLAAYPCQDCGSTNSVWWSNCHGCGEVLE